MKILNPLWRDLGQGYRTAGELESKLREKWEGRLEDARRRKYEKELAGWRQRWEVARRILRDALLAGGVVAFIPLLVLLVGVAEPGSTLWLVLVLILAAWVASPVAAGWWFFHVKRRGPEPDGEDVVDLDLTRRWWEEVRGKGLMELHKHGDEGEQRMLRYLEENLGDDYLCAYDLMLARSLDCDLLVVGPTGGLGPGVQALEW